MVNGEKPQEAQENKQSTETEKEHQKPQKKAKVTAADKEKEKLAHALKTAEEKHHALHDKYLRLAAEYDNYRKRTVREKTELIKTASEELLIKVLPFVDDMERGLKAVNDAKDQKAVKEGMFLIYNRFVDFLQQNGLKEIEAVDKDFTADLHEAVARVPVQDESLKGKVVDVIEKGYYLHDKVIRYPKVVVGE